MFVSRTWRKKHGLLVGMTVAGFHLLFLLYLHFAYHSVYYGMVISKVTFSNELIYIYFISFNFIFTIYYWFVSSIFILIKTNFYIHKYLKEKH